MTTATNTPTLDRAEYEARRDMLTEELEAAQRSLDEAALEATTGADVDGVLTELRADRDTAQRALEDLYAAWRAAQEYGRIQAREDDAARRRAAYEEAGGHLDKAARLVAEVESLALKMGDLVEQAADEDQAARGAVSRNVSHRGRHDPMTATPLRLILNEHELEELLNTIRSRFFGKRENDTGLTARAAGRASARRKSFAAMLGQDFNNDSEQEAA